MKLKDQDENGRGIYMKERLNEIILWIKRNISKVK